MDWLLLADRVLAGEEITDDEALSILNCPDDELLLLLQGAYRIRQTYYGNKVKLNMIMNAKSGLCPENCGYCSQSSISTASISTYKMVNKDTILQGQNERMKRK
ncbi:Biotin synthase [Anoxybacillus sp. BCO1]|nr:Biotin synthase [Anoxybacillus sp. BCO1]